MDWLEPERDAVSINEVFAIANLLYIESYRIEQGVNCWAVHIRSEIEKLFDILWALVGQKTNVPVEAVTRSLSSHLAALLREGIINEPVFDHLNTRLRKLQQLLELIDITDLTV